MYLEKLEIQGFKSFANKNKLVFSNKIDKDGHRGLTAIVGPNGSGKSNIADAVRWVLGEQSLKTLRGKKSEDVIFNGSDQKSRLSMAEVSLFLNNADRTLTPPVATESDVDTPETDASGHSLSPFDYDEIVITRRLYRSGDSEYLLNGSRVRLADIQIMLAKANVGQRTYSVIGQGMVENFLNTGAAERKDFFDEATGVKQFQIKRDSALNKLENSYDNMQQVEMLLTEIRPRLKILTRQVDKLKKRGALEEELFARQHKYYHSLWQDINEKLSGTSSRINVLEKDKTSKESELAAVNAELEKIKSESGSDNGAPIQEKLRSTQNERTEIVRAIARLNAELELQLEAQGQFDAAWLNNKHEELKTEEQLLQTEIKALNYKGDDSKEATLRYELQQLGAEINRREEIKRATEAKQEEKNQLLKRLARLDAVLEANLEAQGQFDVAWLNNKHDELNRALDSINQEISKIDVDTLRGEVSGLDSQRVQLDSLIAQGNTELQNINREIKASAKPVASRDEINLSIENFLSRLDAIKNEENLDRIKTLIEEAKQEFQKQIRTLIDGENEAKLEKARTLQEEIIKYSEDRQALIAEINDLRLELSTRQERRRLLEAQQIQASREIKEIKDNIARSEVKFDAIKINNEKEVLNKQLSSLEEEIIKALTESQTGNLYNDRQRLVNEINECRVATASKSDKQRHLNEKLRQLGKEIKDIQEKIAKSQVKFDADKINRDKAALNKRLAEIDAQISSWQAELQSENERQNEEKRRLFAFQSQIQGLQSGLNIISNELNALKVEAARQETRLEDLENNIRDDELEISLIKEYVASETDDGLDDDRLRKRINELKNQLEMIGGIDPETEKEYSETNERYNFLEKQTADLDTAIQSLEKVIAELDINIKERFEKEFKIISEKFSEYFKILFNGGSAKIDKLETLDNEEGVTVDAASTSSEDDRFKRLKLLRKRSSLGLAGIEIQATPPGKKIQTISMLSGGERALTAIALICAIISANPSPFVVLDEVDAALDEANSERLAQILDDLSSKTQFVTITHNRASMKRASIIYGVTMKADGVSQLLSIRLDDINAFRS
ncbi:MAG: AAA family ATPase [bacterium]|nr:AAA family ATPase [bacterium]